MLLVCPRLTFCRPGSNGFPLFRSFCAALIIASDSHADGFIRICQCYIEVWDPGFWPFTFSRWMSINDRRCHRLFLLFMFCHYRYLQESQCHQSDAVNKSSLQVKIQVDQQVLDLMVEMTPHVLNHLHRRK